MALPQQSLEQFKYVEAQRQNQPTPPQPFEARLLKTAQEYYALTRQSRARRYPLWLQIAMFGMGIHYFYYDPVYAQATEMPQEKIDECMYTPSGLLQFAVETIASQYGSSNGKITSMPVESDDPKIKAVVRGLREYADYLDWKFYQACPSERQTECKLIPLRGVYNLIEFDKTKGKKITLPQYEAVEKQVCQDCGGDVETDSIADSGGAVSQACPACGSTNIAPITAGVTNKGNVERRTGEPVRRIFDAYQVEVYDRNRGIEESPYLICDDILFKTEAKALYPHLKEIKGSATLGSYSDGYIGLHFLHQIQCLIGNSGGLDQSKPSYIDGLGSGALSVSNYGSFLSPLLCWRRRVWFDKEIYADWKIGDLKPVQLPGRNEPIPPETKVISIFPSGLCFHIINGDTVVLTEDQDKDDVWSFVGYRMPQAGLHGGGVSSLVSLTKGYDSANSFGLQALLMAAMGILIKDERVPKARNVPGSSITIPQNARLAGESVDSLVKRIDMGAASAISSAEPIKEGFRGLIGDNTMAGNAYGGNLRPQGLGKDTATAAKLQAGVTGTLVNPPLELYAAHRAKVVEQAVKQVQSNSIRPVQFGKFGDTVVKWFDVSQIPEDVRFGVAEDSWRMRTLETQREDVMAVAQLLPMVEGNEPVKTKMYQVFNLDDDIDDSAEWEIVAEKQLDAMKILAPQFEGMAQQAGAEAEQLTMQAQQLAASADPAAVMKAQMIQEQAQQMVAQVPLQLIDAAGATPLPMDQQGIPTFLRFLENVRLSDDWDSFSPLLQDAIQRLWAMHQQGVGQAGAIATEQRVIASEPAREAQKQDQAEQAGLEAQNQPDDEQTAAHARQMQMVNLTHEQTAETDDLKHRRAIQLENLKADHAMELEKVRAKKKPS